MRGLLAFMALCFVAVVEVSYRLIRLRLRYWGWRLSQAQARSVVLSAESVVLDEQLRILRDPP